MQERKSNRRRRDKPYVWGILYLPPQVGDAIEDTVGVRFLIKSSTYRGRGALEFSVGNSLTTRCEAFLGGELNASECAVRTGMKTRHASLGCGDKDRRVLDVNTFMHACILHIFFIKKAY